MIQVYSYIRFSSKKQIDGDSYRRQFEQADTWLKNREGQGFVLAPLKLHDLGVSAFKGKNKETGALAKFRDMAANGQIEEGSILLVEHLDRLSRQGVGDAMELFLGILKAGIKIVVLRPSEMEFSKASINDLVSILIPLVYFHLAHAESENKSFRIKKAWSAKRSSLADGKKFSRKCPAWLTPKGDKFEVNEGAKAIKFIFEQTAAGVGQKKILRALVKDFAPIGRVGKWNSSYIQKVLSDRTVLGEYRPRVMDENGKFIPTGDVFPGYYPPVINEDLWYSAQSSKAKRKKLKGRDSGHINLFKGLLFNAHDGHQMHMQTTRDNSRNYIQRRLVSYGHLRTIEGSDSVSVDYDRFEELAISVLSEVKLVEVDHPVADGVLVKKQKELATVEAKIAETQEAMMNGSIKALVPVLQKLEQRQTELQQEIELVKGITPLEQPLKDAKTTIEQLKGAMTDEAPALRLKVQGLVRDLIESIYLKPEKHYGRVYTFVQFNFRNGKFKQCHFGPGVYGGSMWAEDEISWTIDLRDMKACKKQFLKGIAELCNDVPDVVIPYKVPSSLGEAAKMWLQVVRGQMSKESYRIVPPKIARFVEFFGEDLQCKQINANRWNKWTQHLLKATDLSSKTALIVWGRSREYVRWLIEKGIIKAFEELNQSGLALFKSKE